MKNKIKNYLASFKRRDVWKQPHFTMTLSVVLGVLVLVIAFLITRQHFLVGGSWSDDENSVQIRTIKSVVTATGTVVPAEKLDLASEMTGRIVAVPVKVGDVVAAGQTLVVLDSSALTAQLAQAEANYEREKLKLEDLTGLANGPADSSSLASIGVSNSVQNLRDKLINAYASLSNDTSLFIDPLYENPRTNPQFKVSMASGETTYFITGTSDLQLNTGRSNLNLLLKQWQTVSADLTTEDQVLAAEKTARAALETAQNLLKNVATAMSQNTPTDTAALSIYSAYQAGIAQALADVNVSLSSLNAADQQYASARSAGGSYEVKTQDTIVKGALAQVQAIKAQLVKTVITAPLASTVSVQNAHIGEIATPGAPLVSLLSSGKFQLETYVSQDSISQLQVGQLALVTLDSYGQGVVFNANVISIDPDQTMINGVGAYKVKLQFTKTDSRLKTGLTANLKMIVAEKENVLGVPNRSLITRGTDKFVLVESQGQQTERPVTTGITDGVYTEILSGLVAGEKIINFGSINN